MRFSVPIIYRLGRLRRITSSSRLGDAGARSAAALAGAGEHGSQPLGMEGIAADAEILVGPAARRHRPRAFEKALDAPAVGDAHALGMAHRNGFVGGLADQRVQNVDKVLLDEVADRELRLEAAGIDVAVRLDRDFRAAVAVLKESEPARPAVAEIVGERRRRQVVRPGAAARPQLADPGIGRGAEEAEERPLLLVPLPQRVREAGALHAGALEEPRQPLAERRLLRLAFEPDMEIVDPGDRDHPDPALQQRVDDGFSHEIAGRLHHDLDAALAAVARGEALDDGIGHALAHWLDQRFAAREDDAPDLLGEAAIGGGRLEIAVGHALGEMVDDAREVGGGLAQHLLEGAARIGAEARLVAVLAAPVACPAHDIVDRFHRRAAPLQRGERLTATTRQGWPWPGPRWRSIWVSEQLSMVKASAVSGERSSASARAARIVPPWATAMMSRPACCSSSRRIAGRTRSRRSRKLSPPSGAIATGASQKR